MNWLHWAVANGIPVTDPGDLVVAEQAGVTHWMLVRVIPEGRRPHQRVLAALRSFDELLSRAWRADWEYRGLHVLMIDGQDIAQSKVLLLDNVPIRFEDWVKFLKFEQPGEWYERRVWPIEATSRVDRQRAERMLTVLRKLTEEAGLSLSYALRYLAVQGQLPKRLAAEVQKGGTLDHETLLSICAAIDERHIRMVRDFLEDARWMAYAQNAGVDALRDKGAVRVEEEEEGGMR
jgi:hypothetical protein